MVYRHNGDIATSVQVRDEFGAAMSELAKAGVPGLRTADVVKKLAQIINTPAAVKASK